MDETMESSAAASPVASPADLPAASPTPLSVASPVASLATSPAVSMAALSVGNQEISQKAEKNTLILVVTFVFWSLQTGAYGYRK